MLITPNSLSINQLFSSTNEQYVIPSYQRRYSWHQRQIWELVDDILFLEDSDTHLLGSIVCLSGHHTAGVNKLELVDGQQRLTTISILLECIRQRLVKDGENSVAAEVTGLLTAKPLGGVALRKIALDSIDAAEFDRLVKGTTADEFQNQNLKYAFGIIREWLDGMSLADIGKFLYRLRNQAVIIRLDVNDAKDAFKLFETINNRGLRLSPTDIIKNFLLGNAARFSKEALQSARERWTKLIVNLDGTNPDAFFRYFLAARIQIPISASEVVPKFKALFMNEVNEAGSLPDRHFYADADESDDAEPGEAVEDDSAAEGAKKSAKVSFEDFLSSLALHSKVYGELVLVRTDDPRTDRHLRNLSMIKSTQTYGFLMHLRVNGCDEKVFREILKLTESLVLRRHICRERANENETLFAKLCGVDPTDPTKATRAAYREHCPSDEKFQEEFATASFPANLIDRARYCLEQFELAEHGEHAELQVLGSDSVHVEHIIPQKIKTKRAKDEFGDWVTYLGDKAEMMHPKYVSKIGNLTIFSGTLNIGASNNPFARKKQAYRESGILITNKLASMSQFKFRNVDKRGRELASIAVGLWPRP